MVKNSPVKAGDLSVIPGSEDPLEKGGGNPLCDSCLESPIDRGAWWAAVHGVPKEAGRTEPACMPVSYLVMNQRSCSIMLKLHWLLEPFFFHIRGGGVAKGI